MDTSTRRTFPRIVLVTLLVATLASGMVQAEVPWARGPIASDENSGLSTAGLAVPTNDIADNQLGLLNGALSRVARSDAVDLISSQLVQFIDQNQPVIRDWNTVYPHVDTLPGPPFKPLPVSERAWTTSLVASGYQSISLPPGDYAIPVQLYCMHFAGGSGPGFTYLLGPFRGTRARMISTLIGRASIARAPHIQVQVLAWELQVGDNYQQLVPSSRALFNRLLPDFRNEMGPGFLETVAQYWSTIAKAIPGAPPLQSVVNHGPVSALLASYRKAQLTIAESAGNYQALSEHLLFTRLGGHGVQTQIKPWSIVAPGVYERLITSGSAMSPGMLQIRVIPQTGAMRLHTDGSVIPASYDETVASNFASAPVGSVVGYPVNCNDCQIPLSEIIPSCATPYSSSTITANGCATPTAPPVWSQVTVPVPTGCSSLQHSDETISASCENWQNLSKYNCHITLNEYGAQGLLYAWQEYSDAKTAEAVETSVALSTVEIGLAVTGVGLLGDAAIDVAGTTVDVATAIDISSNVAHVASDIMEGYWEISSMASAGQAWREIFLAYPNSLPAEASVAICYAVTPPQGMPAFMIILPVAAK